MTPFFAYLVLVLIGATACAVCFGLISVGVYWALRWWLK